MAAAAPMESDRPQIFEYVVEGNKSRPVEKIEVGGRKLHLNPDNVVTLRLIMLWMSQWHLAVIKHGTKYSDKPDVYGRYAYVTEHPLVNENLGWEITRKSVKGTVEVTSITPGACLRGAAEELNLDLKSLVAHPSCRVLYNDAVTNRPRTHVMYPKGEIVHAFAVVMMWDDKESALPAIGVHSADGTPIPYGETVVKDNETLYEIAEAEWLPLSRLFKDKLKMAYGQEKAVQELFCELSELNIPITM